MPLPTNNFEYYFKRIQIEAGLQVVPFPVVTQLSDWDNASDIQRRIKWALDETLRYVNVRYWLAFQEVEYLLTTISGQKDYDISVPPYSQIFWRVDRMGRNGVIRFQDGIVLEYRDYTDLDYLKVDIVPASRPIQWSGFGIFLRLFPKPTGEILRVRYYPTAIATDVTGSVYQNELILSTDIPTLNDEWQDALKWGAVFRLRLTDRGDGKTQLFEEMWADWEQQLAEKTKPGEDAITYFNLSPANEFSRLDLKIFPFRTSYP